MTDKMQQNNIRLPLAAGQFYPADTIKLQTKIKQYLDAATDTTTASAIGAIMVPHAGYDFSASVAACAYKRLFGGSYQTAILMCNSHAVYFDGVAIDNHDVWRTPLGDIEVDKELAEKLNDYDKSIQFNDEPFSASDQTIEVQLPFLQAVLKPGFKILPIYFGNAGEEVYKKLAATLAANLREDDLVVVSSDMSHYPSYADANKIDQATLVLIKSGGIEKLEQHIDNTMDDQVPNEETLLCGIDGVKTVMELRKLKEWGSVEVLRYANSGDVPIGSKDSVVGYGAVVFLK